MQTLSHHNMGRYIPADFAVQHVGSDSLVDKPCSNDVTLTVLAEVMSCCAVQQGGGRREGVRERDT